MVVVYPDSTRQYALTLFTSGLTALDAGMVIGVPHKTITAWAREAGLQVPRHSRRIDQWDLPGPDSEWVDARGHLNLAARVLIQIRHRKDHASNAAIAREIGVHRATIGRELARMKTAGWGYRAPRAHTMALCARKRPKPVKLATPGPLRHEVIRLLNDRFSPEQISAELRRLYPERDDMHVSHEAIYQALYIQTKGCLREELKTVKALRTGRATRKTRSVLPPRDRRRWIGDAVIANRPAEVEDRAVPGHWEGDLIIGQGGRSALITLAERSTRFVLIHRLGATKDAATVAQTLTTMMNTFPASLRRSLTWDQGTEMRHHARFTVATNCPVYFCDPHSPWQRGTNENTNGLVRDFFPKGTDFTHVSDAEVAEAEYLLNIRPRKTLNWAKPGMMMNDLLNVAPTD